MLHAAGAFAKLQKEPRGTARATSDARCFQKGAPKVEGTATKNAFEGIPVLSILVELSLTCV